jgi:hypothetical protein
MATKHKQGRVVAASDHGICELLKAIRAGKQAKFKPAKVLGAWAAAHGIADRKDRKSFVKEALAVFETEVVVRGLTESGRSQPLFSPMYTLFEPRRRTDED